MVRVIQVHHFAGQSIQTCEDPVAVTTAPPDRLLVALAHHVVEVRDLNSKTDRKNSSEVLFSFPTVDQVCYMLHCVTGNYVVTLETKLSRQGRETVYTRVYANWDHCGGDQQPMRARIAGRVTPSSSQTGGDTLEMIELPVKFSTTSTIACCQATGNLLVSSQTSLCLFQLVSRTHDISRLRFLDFELWPVTLELSFAPAYLAVVEDVVAAMDSESLHVFRINKGVTRASDWNDRSSNNSGSPSITRNSVKKPVPKKIVVDEVIDLDALTKDTTSPNYILFPSIEASRNESQLTPFKSTHSGLMGVAVKEMPTNEPWAEQMTTMVESLLQLHVSREQLHCLNLRPLYYTSTTTPTSQTECPRLRSPSYSRLAAINVVIATHQEAYLYHFPVENGDTVNPGYLISVFSFTSPVMHISLEPYALHALTQTTLETYTMRSTHAIYNKLGEVTIDDPVCLVGLRPFIGPVELLLSDNHVVILAACDGQTGWTVYSLRLPSADTLHSDMAALAASHQHSVSGTYRHLLTEAHAILYTDQFLSPSPLAPRKAASPVYRASCQRLADHFLTSTNEVDWELGTALSEEAEDNPTTLLARLQAAQAEALQKGVEVDIGPGLAHYLLHCLASTPTPEAVWLPPTTLDCLPPHLLADLLLQSPTLREATTDRLIENLRRQHQISSSPVECLALITLHVERGQTEEAKTLVNSLEDSLPQLSDSLLQNWKLLLDSMRQGSVDKNGIYTFSDVGVILMETKPQVLASILAALVTEKHTLDLQQVLQIFLSYLPSRMGVAGTAASGVLQGFLERVLVSTDHPDTSHPPTKEALQILMRSYLSDLRVNNKGNESNPFPGKRPFFAYMLPPFSSPEHPSLIKLEWLICSGWLNSDCLAELTQYVKEVLPSCLSLLVLAQPSEGLPLLIEKCPQAIPQYTKDRLKNEADLKQLITLLEVKVENDTKGVYEPILKEVLDYLSNNLAPEVLWKVLPGGSAGRQKYKSHLATCQQIAHANHIRSVIIATARQLLATLNL
uniref:BLOC-2 complex member HPS3 N-terminal domain-containing protein n=1 Tax=Graphocephala atropunctata TaxID=36148 RepID=A0A1B6LA84_9HEMI